MPSPKTILRRWSSKCSRTQCILVAFCLALVAIVWWVALDRVRFDREREIDRRFTENSNFAIALEEHAIRTFTDLDQTLLLVKHEYERRSTPLDIFKMLREGGMDSMLLDHVAIADARGAILHGRFDSRRKPENVADCHCFQVHREADSRRMYIGTPINTGGKWLFHVSRRINHRDGSFAGVVLAGVNPAYFTHFYDQAELGERPAVTLIGVDGIVRARHTGNGSTFGEDLGWTRLVLEARRASVGQYRSPGRIDGTPRLISYRVLKQFPLIVAVGTSEDEALVRFRARKSAYLRDAALVSAFILIFTGGLVRASMRQERASTLLAHSQARFRAAFDQAAVGIALTSIDGRYLEINNRICEISGYERAEFDGMTIDAIYHADDLPKIMAQRHRLIAGECETAVHEGRYVRKDGSFGWVSVGLSLVRGRDGQPTYFVSLIKDITQSKRAQAALRETESHLADIVHSALHAIVTLDAENRIVTFNPAAERMFGYRAHEVMGRYAPSLAPPGAGDEFWQHLQAFRDPEHDRRVRARRGRLIALARDGSQLVVEVSASRHGARGDLLTFMIDDVTPFVAAERRLLQLSTAVEQSPVAIVITGLGGEIEYVNARFRQIYGYGIEEVKGRNARLLRSGNTPVERYEEMWRTIQSGLEWSGEIQNRKKNGELIWELMRIIPIVSAAGVTVNYMAVKEDITARKAAELSERAEQEQILHNARLVSMGEMAGALAHEINQPLSAIANYGALAERLLAAPVPDWQKLAEIVAYIKQDALRGGEILWRMREFVRKRKPCKAPTSINAAVESVVRLAEASARAADVAIELNLGGDDPLLSVDRIQIEQVLFNLVANGIEAMKDVTGRRHLEIATRIAADELHVRVSDRGCGLPDGVAMELFTPFFTTKAHGMGMGLAISRSIVEAHGGRLWAVANEGPGTTFHFTLPLTA